jgi:hypothetical protein
MTGLPVDDWSISTVNVAELLMSVTDLLTALYFVAAGGLTRNC